MNGVLLSLLKLKLLIDVINLHVEILYLLLQKLNHGLVLSHCSL